QGDTLQVIVRGGVYYGSVAKATVTIGDVSEAFIVTAKAAPIMVNDTTPDAFRFGDLTGVLPDKAYTSNSITVQGINTPTPIRIGGGIYSINGGEFTNATGTVNNGDTVQVSVRVGVDYGSVAKATVTIGDVSAVFSVTVMAASAVDSTPDPFTLTDMNNIAPGQLVLSTPITISGINTAVPITIKGGDYTLNGSGFTHQDGTVRSGDTVQIKLLASVLYSTSVESVLTVGTVSDTFTVTTQDAPIIDATPDSFSFKPQNGVSRGQSVASNVVSIKGVSMPVKISVVGGEGQYAINKGAFTRSDGVVVEGDTVQVRVIASSEYNETIVATVLVGGVPARFSVTTQTAPPSLSGWARDLVKSVDLLPKIGGGDSYGATMDGVNEVLWVAAPQATSQGFKQRGVIYPWQRGSDGRFVEGNALSQGMAGDQFGRRMVFDQAFAFVAAPYVDRDALKDIGRVYVYQRQGDRYVSGKALEAPESYGNAQFGQAISVSANWLAVGAPGVGKDDGRVYLYAYERGQWVRRQTLSAPKGQEGSRFGTGLALAGDWLVVGAPQGKRDTHLGLRSGMVFAYQLKGDQWQAVSAEQLPLPDASQHRTGDLGAVIKLVGETLAVVAPKTGIRNTETGGTHSEAGRIFLYSLDGGTQTWRLDDTLQMPMKYLIQNGAQFGSSLSLTDQGRWMVVGAPGADQVQELDGDNQFDIGRVFVYQLRPTGWELVHELKGEEKSTRYGTNVQFTSQELLIANGKGLVQVYKADTGQ
ncbi:MAG: FG-GAP repeat protein, partial [Methylococcaceae bacterium]